MKSLVLLLALQCTLSKAAVIQSRTPQSPHAHSSTPESPLAAPLLAALKGNFSEASFVAVVPKAKVVNIEQLGPKLRQNTKRIVTKFGPYILVGKGQPQPPFLFRSLDPNGQAFVSIISDGLCSNCTVLSAKTGFWAKDGSEVGPAQGLYIHHIVSRDISKKSGLPVSKCRKGQAPPSPLEEIGSEFIAHGEDGAAGTTLYTSQDGKYNSGFFVGSNDNFFHWIDLVNYRSEPREVYVSYEIEYADGHVGKDASAGLISVTGCAEPSQDGQVNGHGIQLNATGVAVTQSPPYIMLTDGEIVAGSAHMHDGGTKMILFINNKEVCTSEAIYGKGGDNNDQTIVRLSMCPTTIPFKKGDSLTMDAVYNLAQHPLRKGSDPNVNGMVDVMGMMYLTFAADT